MKKLSLFLIFMTTATAALGQTEIKPHMQNFYFSLENLNTYLADKDSFLNSKNNQDIQKALTDFNEKIIKLKKEQMMNSVDLKFRFKLLSDGLNEAESTFKAGQKDYSYWILKSTLNNCFACHTQKGLSETGYKVSVNKNLSDFNKAEFLFLYRNYTEAVALYEKILTDYPKNSVNLEMLETALNRLMFYQVRVIKNEQENLALLNRIAKNENLPSFTRNNISAWRKYLTIKKFRVLEDLKVSTSRDLENFINDRNQIAGHYKLHGQRFLVDLETSSYLFSLLESKDHKKLRPWVLYWLAMQEKDYRLNMFDQSTDYYLKECIERYPKTTAAKKCYDLYRDISLDSFTGSRGTDVPESVLKELESYKKLVQ